MDDKYPEIILTRSNRWYQSESERERGLSGPAIFTLSCLTCSSQLKVFPWRFSLFQASEERGIFPFPPCMCMCMCMCMVWTLPSPPYPPLTPPPYPPYPPCIYALTDICHRQTEKPPLPCSSFWNLAQGGAGSRPLRHRIGVGVNVEPSLARSLCTGRDGFPGCEQQSST